MTRRPITENDFLIIRSKLDEARKEISSDVPDQIYLPKEDGGDGDTDIVSVNALLLTTLTAISKATRKLKGSELTIDMHSQPLKMKFSGTIVGISREDGDIFLNLEN